MHKGPAGRAVAKQNKENLKLATETARAIINSPRSTRGNPRKWDDASIDEAIGRACLLIANGATVVDALKEVQVSPDHWYQWQREGKHNAADRYHHAMLCHHEVMASQSLKIFQDLQVRRDEAKETLRQETKAWRAAQRKYDNELADWTESDKESRGKRPRYTGPDEPTYHGPEEWELTNAREQARLLQFHLQSNLERFKKREKHNHNINNQTSILHSIDVKNIKPGEALATYHKLIEGKLEK